MPSVVAYFDAYTAAFAGRRMAASGASSDAGARSDAATLASGANSVPEQEAMPPL